MCVGTGYAQSSKDSPARVRTHNLSRFLMCCVVHNRRIRRNCVGTIRGSAGLASWGGGDCGSRYVNFISQKIALYVYAVGNHKDLNKNKYTLYCTMYDPLFLHHVAALHAVKHGSRKGLARANFTCLSGVKLLNRMYTNWEVLVCSTYTLGCTYSEFFWENGEPKLRRVRKPDQNWIIRHFFFIFCFICHTLIVWVF